MARLAEAEDTLRAIGAGEVDAFVVPDGNDGQRVFTLESADRPYRIFVENMRDGAATVSPSGLILYANRRLADLLARPRQDIVGAQLSTFVAGDALIVPRELRGLRDASESFEWELLDNHGTTVPVLVGVSALEVGGDDLTCLTFSDLTAHKSQGREIAQLSVIQAEQMADLQDAQVALIQQATHDALTGLPNRALLVDRIDQALSQAQRSARCTAVYFIDVDRFKHVNDTKGHAAGDIVLRRVAKTLTSVLRPMDTVARLGGDEFVVLAPDIDSRLHAVDLGTRIVEVVCRQPEFGDGEPVTISVGLAVSMRGRKNAETMVSEADTAMYKAKSLGGARAEIFDEALGKQAHDRLSAHNILQTALGDHRVVAHFQPLVDIRSRTVAGFEALARIVQPDGSLLPPAAFIPIAEDTGLVVPLGERILGLACDEARRWPLQSELTVAVNISARQFEPGDLTMIVRNVLKATDLNPRCLHLELTETALIDIHPEVLTQMGHLRDLGVHIGLDDFGTGYASLTHLRRLPVTFVKIDQSFVQGVGGGRDDDRIVSAVIDLAANLGLRSIAEGVETEAQFDRLLELGCDQAQGFLFGRPLPPSAVAAIVESS
jgi:diguanylate cyclase (GGDEF)-like protein/PAS domain S-box-containing protein